MSSNESGIWTDADSEPPFQAAYPAREIEARWQARWAEEKTFRAIPKPGHPKFYCYEFPPYPNGPLHIGHVRNYSIGDATARYRRQRGDSVLYTQGFDAFGLPNDLAAREQGSHPQELTDRAIRRIKVQLRRLGLSYDTDRFASYHDREYYVWTQKLFLELLRADLAYRKLATVNWCARCQTTLADDQVIEGACWRCSEPVGSRKLLQWFVRTTAFADSLADGTEASDWPEIAKASHRYWVGRTRGVELDLAVAGREGDLLRCFLAQPERIEAITFVSLPPEHPLIERLLLDARLAGDVSRRIQEMRATVAPRRTARTRSTRRGVLLGWDAVHPTTGRSLPLVVVEHADDPDSEEARAHVAGHPQDDRLAESLGIDVKASGPGSAPSARARQSFEADEASVDQGRKRPAVRFRLRDWLISRQRYWGPPFPIVYCRSCGIVEVPEGQLPVVLPRDVDFSVQGNPLEYHASFVSVPCPRCGRIATRETDTMDAFMNCLWFPYRYCQPQGEAFRFDSEEARYWMPADVLVGGVDGLTTAFFHERFLVRAFREWGRVDYDEPTRNVVPHEMVVRDGRKMSKSHGNSVDPESLIDRYGADTLRLAILSMAPPHKKIEWSESKLDVCHAYLGQLWDLVLQHRGALREPRCESPPDEGATALRRSTHALIEKVTRAFETYRYNVAIHSLFRLRRVIVSAGLRGPASGPLRSETASSLSALVVMLAPLAPHAAESLWEEMGGDGFVSVAPWPAFDPVSPATVERTLVVQVDGALFDRLQVDAPVTEERARELALTCLRARSGLEDDVIASRFVRSPRNELVNLITRGGRTETRAGNAKAPRTSRPV